MKAKQTKLLFLLVLDFVSFGAGYEFLLRCEVVIFLSVQQFFMDVLVNSFVHNVRVYFSHNCTIHFVDFVDYVRLLKAVVIGVNFLTGLSSIFMCLM